MRATPRASSPRTAFGCTLRTDNASLGSGAGRTRTRCRSGRGSPCRSSSPLARELVDDPLHRIVHTEQRLRSLPPVREEHGAFHGVDLPELPYPRRLVRDVALDDARWRRERDVRERARVPARRRPRRMRRARREVRGRTVGRSARSAGNRRRGRRTGRWRTSPAHRSSASRPLGRRTRSSSTSWSRPCCA